MTQKLTAKDIEWHGCVGERTCPSCQHRWSGTCLCLCFKCPKCGVGENGLPRGLKYTGPSMSAKMRRTEESTRQIIKVIGDALLEVFNEAGAVIDPNHDEAPNRFVLEEHRNDGLCITYEFKDCSDGSFVLTSVNYGATNTETK